MLRVTLILILAFALGTIAATKSVVKKIAKPDSTVKIDTTMVVTNDSLQITEVYKDTLILIKADTVKIPGKIKKAVPIVKVPAVIPAAPAKTK